MIISWLRGQKHRAFVSAVVVPRHKAPGMPTRSSIGSHHKLAFGSIGSVGIPHLPQFRLGVIVGLEGGVRRSWRIEM